MEIKGIDNLQPIAVDPSRESRPQKGAPDFGKVLSESIGEVNRLQAEADEAVEALATGKGVSLHETMIALEKADVSFQLMMEVRNKIVAAYREVLSMQV